MLQKFCLPIVLNVESTQPQFIAVLSFPRPQKFTVSGYFRHWAA